MLKRLEGWWGKIIGLAGGFAIGGPLGAGLGLAAGHAFDRMAKADREGFGLGDDIRHDDFAYSKTAHVSPKEMRQRAFTRALVILAAKMAKQDGVVSHEEIAAFKRIFHIPEGQMGPVGKLWEQAKMSPHGYETAAEDIARMFADSPQVLEELLTALFMIATADSNAKLHPRELAFLQKVAGIFGLPLRDFERVRASSAAEKDSTGSDAYAILGLTPKATDEEVKAAWRTLSREHHPDVLTAQGMAPEFVAVATEKMAAINTAYDAILRERGLK